MIDLQERKSRYNKRTVLIAHADDSYSPATAQVISSSDGNAMSFLSVSCGTCHARRRRKKSVMFS